MQPDPTHPIRTTFDSNSAAYRSNYAATQAALERRRAELARSRQGGGPKYVQRIERGKLAPRERECLIIANEATARGGSTGEPGSGRIGASCEFHFHLHGRTTVRHEGIATSHPAQRKAPPQLG